MDKQRLKKYSKRKQKLCIKYLKKRTPESFKLYKEFQTYGGPTATATEKVTANVTAKENVEGRGK